MANVTDAKHVGPEKSLTRSKCEHLAFRATDTDWQIWIEARSATAASANTSSPVRPWPVRYAIYFLRQDQGLATEDGSDPADADAFVFKPLADATKVSLDSSVMMEFDELPPETPSGVKK